MEREEARVLHILLRPAEFEEVVRCLQPLLHLGIVLDDNAVEDSVNRPHALHLVVVLQCAKHPASQGGDNRAMEQTSQSAAVAEWLGLRTP